MFTKAAPTVPFKHGFAIKAEPSSSASEKCQYALDTEECSAGLVPPHHADKRMQIMQCEPSSTFLIPAKAAVTKAAPLLFTKAAIMMAVDTSRPWGLPFADGEQERTNIIICSFFLDYHIPAITLQQNMSCPSQVKI